MNIPQKELLLGSAQWGWTVDKSTVFGLLDTWYQSGQRAIDCATNYPINRIPENFRAAERILREYMQAHGLTDLKVTMKIGSLDNMRSPEVNLAPSFIQMIGDEYLRLFGSNLRTLMFHWDNREDPEEIFESLVALKKLQVQHGIQPGLSGIRRPDVYAVASAGMAFDIQLKHNLFQSDLDRYLPHFPATIHRYFAYGINAGGLKLPAESYDPNSTFLARGGNPDQMTAGLEQLQKRLQLHHQNGGIPITTMAQVGMTHVWQNPAFSGLVLGVSKREQLLDNLAWASHLNQGALKVF